MHVYDHFGLLRSAGVDATNVDFRGSTITPRLVQHVVVSGFLGLHHPRLLRRGAPALVHHQRGQGSAGEESAAGAGVSGLDADGHLHGIDVCVDVEPVVDTAAGEPPGAVLRDAELCIRAHDDENHPGAPNAAAVPLLDGADGAAGGRCSAGKPPEAWVRAGGWEAGAVLPVGVLCLCGGSLLPLGGAGD